jgi:hypothetical protein
MDPKGKVVMESILETKATTILEFLAGLRGTLSMTFEEGTWAAWLYDLLKPHVADLLVCNPRKNALLKHGNKSDNVTEVSEKSLHTFVLRVGTTESPMQERPVHHMLIHHERFGSKQKDTTALLGDSSCLHPII